MCISVTTSLVSKRWFWSENTAFLQRPLLVFGWETYCLLRSVMSDLPPASLCFLLPSGSSAWDALVPVSSSHKKAWSSVDTGGS